MQEIIFIVGACCIGVVLGVVVVCTVVMRSESRRKEEIDEAERMKRFMSKYMDRR